MGTLNCVLLKPPQPSALLTVPELFESGTGCSGSEPPASAHVDRGRLQWESQTVKSITAWKILYPVLQGMIMGHVPFFLLVRSQSFHRHSLKLAQVQL